MVQVFLEWSYTQTLILTWIIQIPYKWLSHEVFCLCALATACEQKFFWILSSSSSLARSSWEPALSLHNNRQLILRPVREEL